MKKIKRKEYESLMRPMQVELVAMARWVQATGQRLVIVIEGRDTAGKGGTIDALREHLNPRQCRVAALPAPTDREKTQWEFQRYAAYLPAAGEITLFDRSWYNRAGVEKVMGFASDAQVSSFLQQVPLFEKLLVEDGFLLFKYWLCCDQAQQEERFAERLVDPLKRWKLSPIDLQARHHYKDYTRAREAMLKASHTEYAPWTLVDYNNQRRGRLSLIRDLLNRLPDTQVPDSEVEFVPLPGKAEKERYAVLKPIASYPD